MAEVRRQLDLSPEERAAKEEFRALTTNEQGELVLVGLTLEESVWMVDYDRKHGIAQPGRTRPSNQDKRRHIELSERHRLACAAVVICEHELKTSNQPIN